MAAPRATEATLQIKPDREKHCKDFEVMWSEVLFLPHLTGVTMGKLLDCSCASVFSYIKWNNNSTIPKWLL